MVRRRAICGSSWHRQAPRRVAAAGCGEIRSRACSALGLATLHVAMAKLAVAHLFGPGLDGTREAGPHYFIFECQAERNVADRDPRADYASRHTSHTRVTVKLKRRTNCIQHRTGSDVRCGRKRDQSRDKTET